MTRSCPMLTSSPLLLRVRPRAAAARRVLLPALGAAITLALAALPSAARAQAPAPPQAPPAAPTKVRVAVPEFKVEGDGSPALSLQLQDGFVLGLVRAGIQVLDPVDMARKLEGHPELRGCDSSPCLKNIGQLLGARYIVRVKVDVAGNSYKMVARLFSTEGPAPAVLPLATKSRTCDVCTVAEAREYMLRLADAVRPDLEDPSAAPAAPRPAAPPPKAPSLLPPLVAAMGGAVAVAVGAALLASLPGCDDGAPAAMTCEEKRTRSAIAGGLIGAGLVTSAVGIYVTVVRSSTPAAPAPATTVALTFRF
jgi:hypothetical protein